MRIFIKAKENRAEVNEATKKNLDMAHASRT